MNVLDKPCDSQGIAFVPDDVFEICISRVRNRNLRLRLHGVRPILATMAADYDHHAANTLLHLLPRVAAVMNVTGEELKSVYTGRMVPETQPGRPIYDRIFLAPANQRCPLCNAGVVNTLDHHLPKAEYPAYSVLPNNLVPACMWCQKEKLENSPSAVGDQTLHPYFDDFTDKVWLHARVRHTAPATFHFFVRLPNGWSKTIGQRLRTHLEAFKLPKLYAFHAGSELSAIRARLTKLHTRGGAAAVRAHLIEEYDSRLSDHKNSWQTAMYGAAASDPWFTSGGFMPTG